MFIASAPDFAIESVRHALHGLTPRLPLEEIEAKNAPQINKSIIEAPRRKRVLRKQHA